DALIRSGIARTVLLVGSDVHTSLMPFSTRTFDVLHGRDPGPLPAEEFAWNSRFRHLLVLFGDGAGAMVFRAAPAEGENGKVRGILGAAVYGDGNHNDTLLARFDYTFEDLDLLIMHQANLRINEASQKAMGLPGGKVYNNIQRYGNTTSGTLPIAFHEARKAGKAPEGALVAFTALGAGLHWGSVLMRV